MTTTWTKLHRVIASVRRLRQNKIVRTFQTAEGIEDYGGLFTGKIASRESPMIPLSANDPLRRSIKLMRLFQANSAEKRITDRSSGNSGVTSEAEGEAFR